MSPAGEDGFTLLELIVVMAIVGLLAVALQTFRIGGNATLELDRATGAMTDGLRQVQSEAIFRHRENVFGIDVERRRFRPGRDPKPVELADAIDISFTTAREERLGDSTGQIRFFPDGSSTGGRIMLALGNRQNVIKIDWLTGLISVTAHVR
ncbi:MAG: GspH/FimT family pseudopilin [Geminicoccaceae bacterium]